MGSVFSHRNHLRIATVELVALSLSSGAGFRMSALAMLDVHAMARSRGLRVQLNHLSRPLMVLTPGRLPATALKARRKGRKG